MANIWIPSPGPIGWETPLDAFKTAPPESGLGKPELGTIAPVPLPGHKTETETVVVTLKPTAGKEDVLLALLREGWVEGAKASGGLVSFVATPAKGFAGEDVGWVLREVFETPEDSKRWAASQEFQGLLSKMKKEELLVEPAEVWVLGEELEGFFPEEEECDR